MQEHHKALILGRPVHDVDVEATCQAVGSMRLDQTEQRKGSKESNNDT